MYPFYAYPALLPITFTGIIGYVLVGTYLSSAGKKKRLMRALTASAYYYESVNINEKGKQQFSDWQIFKGQYGCELLLSIWLTFSLSLIAIGIFGSWGAAFMALFGIGFFLLCLSLSTCGLIMIFNIDCVDDFIKWAESSKYGSVRGYAKHLGMRKRYDSIMGSPKQNEIDGIDPLREFRKLPARTYWRKQR